MIQHPSNHSYNALATARFNSCEGLKAHQFLMKCATKNLVHSGLKATKEHDYARQIPVFRSKVFRSSQKIKITKTVQHDKKEPYKLEYQPNDPDADEQGFIKKLNINPLIELTDIQHAKHSYSNLLKVYELLIDSEKRTLNLLT